MLTGNAFSGACVWFCRLDGKYNDLEDTKAKWDGMINDAKAKVDKAEEWWQGKIKIVEEFSETVRAP